MKFEPILPPPPPPIPEKDEFTLSLTPSEARTLKALIGGIGLDSSHFPQVACLKHEDRAMEIYEFAVKLYNAMTNQKLGIR